MHDNACMVLPTRLGRLRQVTRLGAGGFASVWLYHDDELDSSVAVKALADNWCQHADVRARFLDEARIMRRADSDHVVRVYDVGETDDGTPYFVMSYADRGTLADRLAEAPLPPREVAELMRQAGQGLQVLHRIGVIHRDVKPQNLLLRTGDDGRPRLLVADLGVAKAVAFASGLTQVVGTPAYMAPEQADPAAGLDVRADVHALGAVAYHLLTGTPLRDANLESVTRAELPAPPTAVVGTLPSAVDDVVGRAVMPDRDGRWPDVASFTDALSRATEPVTAQDTVAASPPWDRTRIEAPPQHGRRPSLKRSVLVPALVGAIVALLLVVGGVGGYLLLRDGSAAASSDVSLDLPVGWSEQSREGTTVVYAADGSGDYTDGTTLTVRSTSFDQEPYDYLTVIQERDSRSPEDGGELANYMYDFFTQIDVEDLGSWQSGARFSYTYFSAEPQGREIWALGRWDRTDAVVTLQGDPEIVEGDERGEDYDRGNVGLLHAVAEQLRP
jgi:serine/threonine protein kinase